MIETDKDMPTLLIDGDILLYKVARQVEQEVLFNDEKEIYINIEYAAQKIAEHLKEIVLETGYYELVICLSDAKNFRKRLFPTYKSNRKNVEKPKALPILRNLCLENLKTMVGDELEADDVMGVVATTEPEIYAIYSQDKDLKNIPVKQWDFNLKKFITPTVLQATRSYYTQILTGDTVDGYKGLPKVGKVKAGKALADCTSEQEMFNIVRSMYEEYYGDVEIAKQNLLEQAGQARIFNRLDLMEFRQHDKTYNPYDKFKD